MYIVSSNGVYEQKDGIVVHCIGLPRCVREASGRGEEGSVSEGGKKEEEERPAYFVLCNRSLC